IAKLQMPEFSRGLTIQGQVFGTAEYMSPEQATGETIDGRSDIYSLGCLAYELITGDPPFVGQPIQILQDHVSKPIPAPSTRMKGQTIPSALDAVILRCLAKNPLDRYQTAAEVRQEFMRLQGMLLTMGAKLTSRRKATGFASQVSPQKMTEGWHALGGEVPELLRMTGDEPELVGESLPTDPEKLRTERQDVLRELAFLLVQGALASTQTSEALERLLVVEEEIASLTGTIALGEQNFDRIRFDFSQREKKIRHGILDLNMERAQLEMELQEGRKDKGELKNRLKNVKFQIDELNKQFKELDKERAIQIKGVNTEIESYRKACREREQEAGDIYQALNYQIEMLRSVANGQEQKGLFERLDRVRSSISQVRGL
ncbi:MAG: protein kinase, partial [Pseudomonadota bacterium]